MNQPDLRTSDDRLVPASNRLFDDRFEDDRRFIPQLHRKQVKASPLAYGGVKSFAKQHDGARGRHERDQTRHYYFRPGRILVAASSVDAVRAELEQDGFVVGRAGLPDDQQRAREPIDATLEALGLPFTIFEVSFDTPAGRKKAAQVPDIIDRLEAKALGPGGHLDLMVAAEHMLFAASHAVFGPGTEVERSEERFTDPSPEVAHVGEGVKILVLDTGGWHHRWFEGSAVRAEEKDVPDEDGDHHLDADAGHGTFIAGVIRSYAPAAQIDCYRLLSSQGHIFELETVVELKARLAGERYDIVNLSFGGPGPGHRVPFILPNAIQALRQQHPDTVFVAAAGNASTSTPFYPAATKGVIGVGSLDDDDQRSDFSNWGPWVDCWAPGGKRVGTFLDWVGPNQDGKQARYDGWARWGGTSFAAPAVCGGIAALMTTGAPTNARDAATRLLADADWVPRIGLVPKLKRLVGLTAAP